jgi:hypothetical protein
MCLAVVLAGTPRSFAVMKTTIRVCFAIAALSLSACEATEDIDEASDCEVICDTFADCVDSEYDTEGCYDRCTQRADSMESRDQEDTCESCLDDLSCTEAAFECTPECAGIVP